MYFTPIVKLISDPFLYCSGVAVEVIYRISNVPSINIQYDCGLLQNLPSIICSYTLELSSDSEVLDMCASPGNKTTHIATLMENMVS